MRPRRLLLSLVSLGMAVASPGMSSTFAAQPSSDIPAWLRPNIGEGPGQIAPVVLQRARALYLQKVSDGAVKNPCYFAMDATRPGGPGRRFYTICEADQTFRAVPTGHGSGRNLKGVPNFANGQRCARNFSNALDSKLTTGGAYLTGEETTSFKGYYRTASGKTAFLQRSFVQFDGVGDTETARLRLIGGHPAVLVRGVCLRKDPKSPYANPNGYVPFGKLVDYSLGRSNGCTSWSPADARQIIPLMKEKPTTLYIYPESKDIEAVAKAVKAGQSPASGGAYWNASCLKEIRSPKFWAREALEPLLIQYRKDHPDGPPQPIPMCKGS